MHPISKSLNALARVVAYGAVPALLYLGLVVATGGGQPEILLLSLYIWVIAGVLINGGVERRKTERDK